jgi:D-galactose 1-dehydrogenase
LGIVAVGKIAHDQHLLAIKQSPKLNLIVTANRNASLAGIPAFQTIEEMNQGVWT